MQGRINSFAQFGARFRDGAAASLAGLYTALSGRILQPWMLTRAAAAPAPQPAPVPAPLAAPPPPALDPTATLREAAQHCARGHFGNAIVALRHLLQAQPEARKHLLMSPRPE